MISTGVRLNVQAVVLNLILRTSSKAGKAAQPQRQRHTVMLAQPMIIKFDDDTEEVTETVVDDADDDNINFDGDDEVDVDDDGPGIIQDDIGDGDELLPNLDDKDEN